MDYCDKKNIEEFHKEAQVKILEYFKIQSVIF